MINFIHIGKCGGVSVRLMLRQNSLSFKTTHTVRTDLIKVKNQEYLISVRNPIDRFCSAFYWRKIKMEKQGQRYRGEKDFLDSHENINSLIANLDELRYNYIHHASEGFDWYLKDFIKIITPKNIKGILFLNSLQEDFDNIFNTQSIPLWLNKVSTDYNLSDKERKILREYLEPDYLVLQDLFNIVGLKNRKTEEVLK
jgi:hypothetical protein